jgi:hypothetical protein
VVASPSHYRHGDEIWRLSRVLGVDFKDSWREGEGDAGSFSTYDATFLRRGPKPTPEIPPRKTARSHFVTADLPAESTPVLVKVRAKQVADDLQILGSGDGQSLCPPLVTAHPYQRGRAIYINGYSSALDYGRMLRRAIFWVARRESDVPRLLTIDPAVRTYLYPSEGLLIAYNCSADMVATRVRFDAALLNNRNAHLQITDVLTGTVRTVPASACRDQGLPVSLAAHEVAFLRVK